MRIAPLRLVLPATLSVAIASGIALLLAPPTHADGPIYFEPHHRVSGIGIERDDISHDLLDIRTERMIESQTFSILRDPQAIPGAKRITGNAQLQTFFRDAGARSGLPPSLIEAIAYLESWGDAHAESPSGPRGIMQISGATARVMGLKVTVVTRYKITRDRVAYKTKRGATRYKTVTHKTPYVVSSRDDRLIPERAIPAAAVYLANLEKKFGGRDWAVFAYHCGPGCVAEMMDLTRKARGIPNDQITVPRMFFSASPAWNRELYAAISQQMQRDYSPTYYFRVRRAEQLLALYRSSPKDFEALSATYKSDFILPSQRAPHRLSVWLRRDDLVFHNDDDIRTDAGRRLVHALDHPAYFGYALNLTSASSEVAALSQASPAALGTLMYIAFETRRLDEALARKGEKFVPLPVTSLVEAQDSLVRKGEALSHSSGQVFDIDYAGLPPGELECLRFVLDDLGWDGYLGFIDEGRENIHIGCAPSTRDFFATVFGEALAMKSTE
jgi:soluble lytic murein transglycosylase-like protein